MSDSFRTIFKSPGDPMPQREKFLSRLFGIFSEKIIALWADDERAPYQNLGRPTVFTGQNKHGHTLDFTLRDRATGKIYVAEMKCEIEYQGFKYFVLNKPDQLAHHVKPAFGAFLDAARRPQETQVRIAGKKTAVQGDLDLGRA